MRNPLIGLFVILALLGAATHVEARRPRCKHRECVKVGKFWATLRAYDRGREGAKVAILTARPRKFKKSHPSVTLNVEYFQYDRSRGETPVYSVNSEHKTETGKHAKKVKIVSWNPLQSGEFYVEGSCNGDGCHPSGGSFKWPKFQSRYSGVVATATIRMNGKTGFLCDAKGKTPPDACATVRATGKAIVAPTVTIMQPSVGAVVCATGTVNVAIGSLVTAQAEARDRKGNLLDQAEVQWSSAPAMVGSLPNPFDGGKTIALMMAASETPYALTAEATDADGYSGRATRTVSVKACETTTTTTTATTYPSTTTTLPNCGCGYATCKPINVLVDSSAEWHDYSATDRLGARTAFRARATAEGLTVETTEIGGATHHLQMGIVCGIAGTGYVRSIVSVGTSTMTCPAGQSLVRGRSVNLWLDGERCPLVECAKYCEPG